MADEISAELKMKYQPSHLAVEDESWKHAGHTAKRKGEGGHYKICLVSDFFDGMSLVERHRSIYDTLKFSASQALHALSIQAYSEAEWKKKQSKHPVL